MTHLTHRRAFRPGKALVWALALLFLAVSPGIAGPAAPQLPQDPPVIHFVVSGEYAFSAARVTVDVRLEEGARLNVTLTSPSGGSENLTMDRDERRYSWTGQLREAGTWRAEATVSGAGSPQSASATVSLEAARRPVR